MPGPTTTGLDIVVAHRGYVTGYVARLATGGPLPNYVVALEESETIGGTVRDEEGHPIEGARVLPTPSEFNLIWPEIYASPNSSLAIATTDAQGRWRADALPADTRPGRHAHGPGVTPRSHHHPAPNHGREGPRVFDRAGHEDGPVRLRHRPQPVRASGPGRDRRGREPAVGRDVPAAHDGQGRPVPLRPMPRSATIRAGH